MLCIRLNAHVHNGNADACVTTTAVDWRLDWQLAIVTQVCSTSILVTANPPEPDELLLAYYGCVLFGMTSEYTSAADALFWNI